ncbi:MAG: DUF4847 family protein [Bacteroidales bacterium]|nr:DUF4847 family protein [Bacteroidales bacterium]
MSKQLALFVLMTLSLVACNNDDNTNEIFDSGVWRVVNFFGANEWSSQNDGGRPVFTTDADLKVVQQLSVTFHDDGSLQGSFVGGTFAGKWSANGKDRTVSVTNISTNDSPSGISLTFLNALKEAAHYKGDSNYLKLAPDDRNSYIQFTHRTD